MSCPNEYKWMNRIARGVIILLLLLLALCLILDEYPSVQAACAAMVGSLG